MVADGQIGGRVQQGKLNSELEFRIPWVWMSDLR